MESKNVFIPYVVRTDSCDLKYVTTDPNRKKVNKEGNREIYFSNKYFVPSRFMHVSSVFLMPVVCKQIML
jgi:hypothetical protein